MMETDSFLFNKPLLIVAITGKYFQYATKLILKFIWCYSCDFKHIESTIDHVYGIFIKTPCVGECKCLCEIEAL